MPLVGEGEQLILLACINQSVENHGTVTEEHILVQQAMAQKEATCVGSGGVVLGSGV